MILGIEFWAETFDFVGKILLAIAALLVHVKLGREKKIDKYVLKELRLEKIIGTIAISFLIIGYTLHIAFFIN